MEQKKSKLVIKNETMISISPSNEQEEERERLYWLYELVDIVFGDGAASKIFKTVDDYREMLWDFVEALEEIDPQTALIDDAREFQSRVMAYLASNKHDKLADIIRAIKVSAVMCIDDCLSGLTENGELVSAYTHQGNRDTKMDVYIGKEFHEYPLSSAKEIVAEVMALDDKESWRLTTRDKGV